MHAGEQVGIDDIVRRVRDQRRLVGRIGVGFRGRDKAGAHVGHVGAERERGRDAPAVGDRARQQDRAVEPLLDLAQQRER